MTNGRQTIRFFSTVALISLTAAGCATMDSKQRQSIDVVGHSETEGMDPIALAAFWGTRYDRDPSDPKAAVSFSKALRAVDNNEEALRVMQNTRSRISTDPDVMLELGKVLIANERAHEAVRPIEQSISLGKSEDWSAYSALGVAYDKIGRHKDAQAQYDVALGLAPNKAQILNNKGLSYALQGRPALAERTLRQATAQPDGTARIRQNFALVLALSGQGTEAERLARSDLPPAIAEQNVRYYRELVAQPAYWPDLASADAELPNFGDDPSTISQTPEADPILQGDPAYRGPTRRAPAPTRAPVPSFEAPAVIEGEPAPEVSAQAPADAAPLTLAFDAPADQD